MRWRGVRLRPGEEGCLRRRCGPVLAVAAGVGCRTWAHSLALGDAWILEFARDARMRRRGGVGSGDGSRDPSGADTPRLSVRAQRQEKAAQARKQRAAARQSPREAAHNKETVAV